MSEYLAEWALYIVAPGLAILPSAYICWRTFLRAGPDAAAARRWIIWFKIAVPLFLISAIWELIQYSLVLGGVFGYEVTIAWYVADVVKTTASLAIVLSLVEAAYWLASVRNNGVPARNTGWSRILAYVVTAILFVLTLVMFGFWVNWEFGLSNTTHFSNFYSGIMGIAYQSAITAVAITLVGISIALLVKTRRDAAHLSPAAKLLLIASVLFMFPYAWTWISVGIRWALMARYNYGGFGRANWLGVSVSFVNWLFHAACLYVLLRLRNLKIGAEDPTKQRSQSV